MVRLEQLKSSKMKELVIKKRLELEEICRRIHMVTETLSIMEDSVEAMESGKNFINARLLQVIMIIYLRKHFILYATSFIVEKDIIRIFY